jgi:hypothetical protein
VPGDAPFFVIWTALSLLFERQFRVLSYISA